MASMSIRGLSTKAVTQLKRRAAREGISLNSLVLGLLQGNDKTPKKSRILEKFDDLNGLAGTWTPEQGRRFEKDTAAFSEVDPALWR